MNDLIVSAAAAEYLGETLAPLVQAAGVAAVARALAAIVFAMPDEKAASVAWMLDCVAAGAGNL